MKVSRFLTFIICITAFCLLYVYQQTEIFRLAYVGQKQMTTYDELLDKNTVLRYNIESSASLINIGTKISGNAEFQMPESYRLISLRPSGQRAVTANVESLFSRIFGVKRQAEAKTIP